jgi:OmcA/MtrC family decaheme c-type cytochrome
LVFGVLSILAVGLSLGVFDRTSSVFAVESADLNDDQMVNGADLLLLQEQWMTDGDVLTPPEARPSSEVISVVVPEDNRPEITFNLLDANGVPLPATGLTIRWIMAKVVEDNLGEMRTHYQSYTTRQVSNAVGSEPPGTVIAQQANYDTGGSLTDLGNGQYLYKFGTVIQGYDPSLTHTVGAQIERRVGGQHAITPLNPLYTFRPDGGTVTNVRELVNTQTCNSCHDRLELHGGGRREVGLCVLCHNPAPGNIDPDSGNPIDMAEMIHKIHRGASLPSVMSGSEYIIYGNGNSPHNYSEVHFPQDIRNCDSCHTGPQADYHLQVPSRRVCGSCHDDVNFETGVGHSENNLPMNNDSSCVTCHPPTGTAPFGASVEEAHIPPKKREGFPIWSGEILDVVNAAPGMIPQVTFSLYKNIDGVTSPVQYPAEANRIAITIASLDVDYSSHRTDTGNAGNLTDHGDGTFTMTLNQPLSASAEGTYAFGLEARGISQGADYENARPSLNANPVEYVAVTGDPTTRRQVIDMNKCMVCHDQLFLHGDNRISTEYCVLCHRPGMSDISQVPAGTDPVSIDFKYMIHKIHTGAELENGYTVYGFGGTPHDYTEIHYPGDRKTCEQCHLPGTYDLPAPAGALNTMVENATGTTILDLIPETSACTACHDSDDAVAHAMDAETIAGLPGGGVNCAACHGEDAAIAVMEAHRKGL